MVGQQIGNYRIVGKLGEGGMGEVFKGVHDQIGRRAAIKVLHPEFSRSPEILNRFLNEARAANIVRHPSIVNIFEMGTTPDGSAYIIMEYLEGESLTNRLRSGMNIGDAVRIGRQIATGMAAAHAAGIVHRDLKPANVILVPDSEAQGGERIKILDFGIAKLAAEGSWSGSTHLKTRTGIVMGTAMYMAPEQCRGARDVDSKVDVYSLGVLLYEMLAGRPPFLATSEGELVTMHLRDEPPLLSDVAAALPRGITPLVHAMLAKLPTDRPSMDEVASTLGGLAGAVGAVPVPSARPSLFQRILHYLYRILNFLRLRADGLAPVLPPPVVRLDVGESIGSFRIVRKLGQGSLGEMYEGEKIDVGWRAAIRILDIRSGEDPEAQKLFFNGARAISTLPHPGIVKVLEFGRLPDSKAYIATDYLEGETLRVRLERGGPPPEAEVVHLMRPVAAALAAAHARGIIHCDLRPEKIMLVSDPAGTHGKILDFGMARMVVRAPAAGMTTFYLAPEQFLPNEDANEQTDVYHFGLVLYEMLAGEAPFPARVTGEALARLHMFKTPPPLHGKAPSVSAVLDTLVDRMLSKVAEERPTMAEVQATLDVLAPSASTSPRREPELPPGISRQKFIEGRYCCMAWSPDGNTLATGAKDHSVKLWDARSGGLLRELPDQPGRVIGLCFAPDGHRLAVATREGVQLFDVATGRPEPALPAATALYCISWSPDGRTLAVGRADGNILMLDLAGGTVFQNLPGGPSQKVAGQGILSLAWSPDGQRLAAGTGDGGVLLFDVASWTLERQLIEHRGGVLCLAWSPDGRLLASGSRDTTIRIWDPATGRQDSLLEGHTETISCVSFSADGCLLASQARDDTVRLWRCGIFEPLLELCDREGDFFDGPLLFHPREPMLATLSEREAALCIWNLDVSALLQAALPAVHYKNARVVLVGESGVGKSGLALVLTGRPFAPTESTHGRRVWTLRSEEVTLADGRKQLREVLLWDLAGQPGYRLIHQLHLSEVAVALVVHDAQGEKDILSAIHHWGRALRQAQRVQQAAAAVPMKKILVAARCDRGKSRLSRERLDELCAGLGFDGYFETSAKEGHSISALASAIRDAIDWDALPHVVSTALFQQIRDFLAEEKKAGRLLSTIEDLYRTFLRSESAPADTKDLYTQFSACIDRVEQGGLIRRLSFGSFVLLQPELMDAYASGLVNSVSGPGNISEEDVLAGRFAVPQDERISSRGHERLLLIALVEDLLRYEIALREPAESGHQLVFPSQLTRDYPDPPCPEGIGIIFEFAGPLLNIYARLMVRLSHSSMFRRKELWKNAGAFTALVGGTCGLLLREIEEGRGALDLFFDAAASDETRYHFEQYVLGHLERHALPDSIIRQRVYVCPDPACATVVPAAQARRRRERGLEWIACGVCERRISLLDRPDPRKDTLLQQMDREADLERERAAAAAVVHGKRLTADVDVLLYYRAEDLLAIGDLCRQLTERGILPMPVEWATSGEIEGLARIKAIALCIGRDGWVPWRQPEVDAVIGRCAAKHCPVVPIVLSSGEDNWQMPASLGQQTWIDFRKSDPGVINDLIRCILDRRTAASPVPAKARLRKLLNDTLRSDSDLNAFCLDHFADVHKRFTAGMDRVTKVNLLLEHTDPRDVLLRLRMENPAEAVK